MDSGCTTFWRGRRGVVADDALRRIEQSASNSHSGPAFKIRHSWPESAGRSGARVGLNARPALRELWRRHGRQALRQWSLPRRSSISILHAA